MNIPKNWFLSEEGKVVHWSSEIEVTATIDFTFIGILNPLKKLYLGFSKMYEGDTCDNFKLA